MGMQTNSEYLGMSQFNLINALHSPNPAAPMDQDPIWIDFFFEAPGDGQGQALVSCR
jgi:hypothetical protein